MVMVGIGRCDMETATPCLPLPGRPLFVPYEGGRIYISVHDRFYLGRKREFKRKIRASHPDVNKHNSAAGRTRKLLKLRESWRKGEAQWYARFGLEPPEKRRTRCAQGSTRETQLLG